MMSSPHDPDQPDPDQPDPDRTVSESADLQLCPAMLVSRTSWPPGVVCVGVRGEIDVATTTEFHARLLDAIGHPSCAAVIVDLSAVEFMAASGVAALADASDHAAGLGVHLVVAAAGAALRLLQMTGTDGGVYPSLTAARTGATEILRAATTTQTHG